MSSFETNTETDTHQLHTPSGLARALDGHFALPQPTATKPIADIPSSWQYGYQEAVQWTTTPVNMGTLKGYMWVPDDPPAYDESDGEYFGLWSGAADRSGQYMMQVAMTYGWNGVPGWNALGIYNCPPGGQACNSSGAVWTNVLTVSPGDEIYYSFQGLSDCNSNGCLWRMTVEDVTTDQSAIWQAYIDVDFQWMMEAVLETSGIDTCDDLPPPPAIDFSDIVFKQWGTGTEYTPSWQIQNNTGVCGWKINVDSSSHVQLVPG